MSLNGNGRIIPNFATYNIYKPIFIKYVHDILTVFKPVIWHHVTEIRNNGDVKSLSVGFKGDVELLNGISSLNGLDKTLLKVSVSQVANANNT